ncbi:hypothetical protein DL89DRAFT_266805 [Linderina pennispora]|uniref:Uncharacterized protein n=1 Tax=Linderina pennispora TaxID=61395 RepID=A0A1Y1WAR2_9FUNG|nr:uncharacterized protein DL89DRAFT_266805 [Linderina pennispora]ORX70613.1 hypothetical protein DL89DRAFT_266805 [Linderina pennispora]
MTRGFIQAARRLVILALRCLRARVFRSFFDDDIFMSCSNLMETEHFAKLATCMGAGSG